MPSKGEQYFISSEVLRLSLLHGKFDKFSNASFWIQIEGEENWLTLWDSSIRLFQDVGVFDVKCSADFLAFRTKKFSPFYNLN